MFASSIARTIQPHLHPGEELLAAVPAQAAGANAQLMAHAVRGPVAATRADERSAVAHGRAVAAAARAGIELDRRMVIAVTTERLLLFRSGGAFTVKVQALLGAVPVGDVDAIAVAADGRLTKAVTLHLAGTAIGVETARGQPAEDLPAALERARARGRVRA